jgi:hypothetical protein
MGRLARAVFGISDLEVSFDRRGFRGADEPPRTHLERVGRAFVAGYMGALDDDRLGPLAARLQAVEPALRGFAYEGAGMALTLLDAFQPWRQPRLAAYLEGPAAPHTYLAHVGVGWAWAKLPGRLERRLARLDPIFRWLALDGYGFHQGFFHWPRAVAAQQVPARVRGYGRRAFDQGLGRSLWFVEGARVERIAATLGRFPPSRQSDLWSGAGLACAYAGGVPEEAVERLCETSRPHLAEFAQGVAFAAKAREAAGNPTPWTELACRAVWGLSAAEASRLADAAGEGLPQPEAPEPSYEIWRRRLQERFREHLPEGGFDAWPEKRAFSIATR